MLSNTTRKDGIPVPNQHRALSKEEIIQSLIDKNEYQSYLEIGKQYGGSFNKVHCLWKKSVDPDAQAKADFVMTSDKFFEMYEGKFDLIFLDGWHYSDQLERDIVNASKHLTLNGAIVVHDISPDTRDQQRVPRISRQWTGDCWRAFVGFRKRYKEVKSYAHKEDWGVGVIVPGGKEFEIGFVSDMAFEEFMLNKKELLGFI